MTLLYYTTLKNLEANSESEDEEYLDKTAKHPLDQISFEKLKKKYAKILK